MPSPLQDPSPLWDPVIFGHDPTPGIVSVHADHRGQAWVWRRVLGTLTLEREMFRPWLFARDLHDVEHLGPRLVWNDDNAEFSVQSLQGGDDTLRYLLRARDAQVLRREVLRGVSQRKGRRISSLREVSGYYSVGTVEGYLMASGRTYFKGLEFDDPVRLQFDLETTSLSPENGRIFMVAIKDNRGFETILEARKASQESEMIGTLLQIIQERDPDIIENHNIHAFDLPFLVGRAQRLGLALNFSRPHAPPGLWKVQDGSTSPHWACAGREIVDTIDAVRRMNLPSAGLKAVSQLFGIAPEGRVYLEGPKIAETYATQPALVRKYALQDVQEVEALARRVLAPSFALACMAPRPYHRLPYAGTAIGMLADQRAQRGARRVRRHGHQHPRAGRACWNCCGRSGRISFMKPPARAALEALYGRQVKGSYSRERPVTAGAEAVSGVFTEWSDSKEHWDCRAEDDGGGDTCIVAVNLPLPP